MLRTRRLLFVDALTSNLSVGYDEARSRGYAPGAARWPSTPRPARMRSGPVGEAGRVAVAREGIALAHGHPLTIRLLKEYIPRWETAGVRMVPVSHVVR